MHKFGMVLAAALLLAAASCGDDRETDHALEGETSGLPNVLRAFFPPEQADALAHQAMPDASELPGTGWEVTASDDFDDNTDDGGFDAALANDPACAELNALGSIGGAFGSGGDDDELPAGRAKVEYANAVALTSLPTSVEVTVEIERTVAEVEGSWGLVKDLLESEETQGCILAAVRASFAADATLGDLNVEISSRTVSTEAPRNGATMGFDIHMDVASIQIDMAMEMYLWPYGNASMTVLLLGVPDAVNAGLAGPVLDLVDQKVAAVGSAQAQSTTPPQAPAGR